MSAARRLGAVLLACAVTAAGTPAVAAEAGDPDKDRCVDAYLSTQRLERESKINEALEAVLICANTSCPSILRADCTAWLGQLRARQASLVVEAHDASGLEVYDVRVWVDGNATPAQERLDGRAFAVDPGPHTLRVEARDGTRKEVPLVVHEAEKARRVVVTFAAAEGAQRPASGAPHDAPRGLPTTSYVLGGVSVLALGSFGYFGLTGKSAESSLDRECAPRCDPNRVDAVHSKYLVADISLAVGIVALGVGVVIALVSSGSR